MHNPEFIIKNCGILLRKMDLNSRIATPKLFKFRFVGLFAQSLSSRGAEGDVAISRLFPVPLFLEIAPQGYFGALCAWAPRLATQGSQ